MLKSNKSGGKVVTHSVYDVPFTLKTLHLCSARTAQVREWTERPLQTKKIENVYFVPSRIHSDHMAVSIKGFHMIQAREPL